MIGQRNGVEHHTDAFLNLRTFRAGKLRARRTQHASLSLVELDKPQERLNGGRLTGTILSYKAYNLAFVHREAHILKREPIVMLRDTVCFDKRFHILQLLKSLVTGLDARASASTPRAQARTSPGARHPKDR